MLLFCIFRNFRAERKELYSLIAFKRKAERNSQKTNCDGTDGTQLGVILKREYLGLVEAKGNTDSSHDSLEDATMDDLVGHGNNGGRNCKNIGGAERNNFCYNRDGDNNCASRGVSQKCICTSNN
ncbi:uncharacterized protein LOC124699639 [Lolium rigidum]|uniref:uncharacterized protein LOC124699639 n=1 Tax=Lolium rigidum TaxID=89674 RepID=UPI001F5CEAA4|nr:uncharacterized protein LOC124699639 [Lolium rigidum]